MTLDRLRNVGISAHIDCGKTTLTERMLFYSGRIHAMHEVRGDVGATMDSTEIERDRGITISSAATRFRWNDHDINLIDTPGHIDFTVEVERSLRVLDGAVMVLCAVGGVQSQTLTVDRQMKRYGVPRIALINKMDRQGASPQRVVAQLRDRLGANPVAVQLPIGEGDEFEGVIDLIEMRAVSFDGPDGKDVTRGVVPDHLRQAAQAARDELIDAVAMLDDTVMSGLLDGRAPSVGELRRVIRDATVSRQLTPVLFASAFKNCGVQEVLDAINLYLPSPSDREVTASHVIGDDREANEVELVADATEPLVAMAFKTIVEPFGQLTFLRIYQGTVHRGDSVRNVRTGAKTRIGRLVRMHAQQRQEITSAGAGDIVGVMGIRCASGDTLTAGTADLVLENIVVAEPVLQRSIAPQRREDSQRLSKALDQFRREDPTFRVTSDPETGETLIAGMGQLHLEVYAERLKSEHRCRCLLGRPRVAYQERPTKPVDFEYRLKKQNGGAGSFAHIIGRLEVLSDPAEDDFVFEDQVVGGCISKSFVAAVREGCREALVCGPLGKYQVVGVKVVLTGGGEHEKDSSEMSFRKAARDAMKELALPQSGIRLWEPVMELRVELPAIHQGTVTGHLVRLRGQITEVETLGEACEIVAEVPLAELFDYANELRSLTQGEGAFSMQPVAHLPVPTAVQQSVLRQRSDSSGRVVAS